MDVACKLRIQRDVKELQHMIQARDFLSIGASEVHFVPSGCKKDGTEVGTAGCNIFAWDLYVTPSIGPYAEKEFCLKVTFPNNYPFSAPQLVFSKKCEGYSHPNVFPSFICLDMLRPGDGPWKGWSGAYTICTFVMQVVGFLFTDDSIEQEYGHKVNRSTYPGRRSYFSYSDSDFSYSDSDDDFPVSTPISTPVQSASIVPNSMAVSVSAPENTNNASENTPASMSSNQSHVTVIAAGVINSDGAIVSGTKEKQSREQGPADIAANQPESMHTDVAPSGSQQATLPLELLEMIVQKANPETQCIIKEGLPELAQAASNALVKETLHCVYTKKPAIDCVLGIGVKTLPNIKTPQNNRYSCAFDGYISYEAYQLGARKSVWNHPFDLFMPLYINAEHGKRALALAHKLFPDPLQLLNMICHLMNHMAVEMVYSGATSGSSITRNMSDASLSGFCNLHQLLIALALEPGSKVFDICKRDVLNFVHTPERRHKNFCPDLGVLLIKYALTPISVVTWDKFLPTLLRETLARQVLHIIRGITDPVVKKRFENPRTDGSGKDAFDRLVVHYNGALTSLRIVMFQAWFSNSIARPADYDGFSQLLRQYDSNNGLPTLRTFEACNKHARSVLQSEKWMDFFAGVHLGFKASPVTVWTSVLRQAVADSEENGYHTTFQGPRDPQLGKARYERTRLLKGVTFFHWHTQDVLGDRMAPWV